MTKGAPAAGAWSNGTNGCNFFGTHDWIAKKAIKADGYKGFWVRVQTALRATDDPDCNDGIDHASGTWWHVYDRWGSEWGDAPRLFLHLITFHRRATVASLIESAGT